jgi:putative transposase
MEARRRQAAVRALAELPERTRADAEATAAALGFDVSFVYKLLARYLADPRVTSMLPGRRGRRVGDLVLATEVDEVIQAAIDEMFLSRQRPRVSDLVTEIRRRCWILGLARPSRKAIQKRIDQRPAREVLARRAGRKVASISVPRGRCWRGAQAARSLVIGSDPRRARSMRRGPWRSSRSTTRSST